MASIGMMDSAYFVSRSEVLAWLNGLTQLDVKRIEDTASGAAACQVLDAIYGDVPLSKVKWTATADYDFIHNYKILQQMFDKKGIPKVIPVDRLVRARYQDNLEFMQWLKKFYELSSPIPDYDPVARRRGVKCTPLVSAPAPTHTTTAPRPAVRSTKTTTKHKESGSSALNPTEMASEVRLEHVSRERSFYYGKLREIEDIVEAYSGPDTAFADQIKAILYSTEEPSEA